MSTPHNMYRSVCVCLYVVSMCAYVCVYVYECRGSICASVCVSAYIRMARVLKLMTTFRTLFRYAFVVHLQHKSEGFF